jgi:alkanesulfonate monooxygenase
VPPVVGLKTAGGERASKANDLRSNWANTSRIVQRADELSHILEGRLTLNIISSDFPGQQEDSAYRCRRSWEVVEILKQAWTQDEINYDGQIYQPKGLSTDPVRPYQTHGGPLLNFGGYSPDALALCGAHWMPPVSGCPCKVPTASV